MSEKSLWAPWSMRPDRAAVNKTMSQKRYCPSLSCSWVNLRYSASVTRCEQAFLGGIALILTNQDPHLIHTFSHRGSSVVARFYSSTTRSHTCAWIENLYQVDWTQKSINSPICSLRNGANPIYSNTAVHCHSDIHFIFDLYIATIALKLKWWRCVMLLM